MAAQQTPLGTLLWDDPRWVSDPIGAPVFGGAKVRIQIFPEEEDKTAPIRADQIAALERFFTLPKERSREIIPHLWAYYCDMRDNVEPPPPQIPDRSRIWEYVHPRWVSPQRDDDGLVYVSVEAECAWEAEHGLQLVLQNGDRWVRVSDFSGHLTDGHAFGNPSLDAWMIDPANTLPVRTLDELLSLSKKR